jgi:hypothetical protein
MDESKSRWLQIWGVYGDRDVWFQLEFGIVQGSRRRSDRQLSKNGMIRGPLRTVFTQCELKWGSRKLVVVRGISTSPVLPPESKSSSPQSQNLSTVEPLQGIALQSSADRLLFYRTAFRSCWKCLFVGERVITGFMAPLHPKRNTGQCPRTNRKCMSVSEYF